MTSFFFSMQGFLNYPLFCSTTTGQVAAATGMAKIASSIKAEFVLALGDNYYNSGVKSVSDPRFGETWDTVYNQASLQVNWYVIGGNLYIMYIHLRIRIIKISFQRESYVL